jgi:hypothetical protein
MKMKKQIVTENITTVDRYDFDDTVDGIIALLLELKKQGEIKGCTNVSIDADYDARVFLVRGERLETDEEFETRKKYEEKRLQNEKDKLEHKKEEEYKLFLKLKQKFEKPGDGK